MFYGNFCNLTCSSNCNHTCDQISGHCNGCLEGFYGDFCTENCSSGCIMSTCRQHEGLCDICKHRFFGEKCEQECTGCGDAGCNKNGFCLSIECRPGFYGMNCKENCKCNYTYSNNNNNCSKYTGYCLDCGFGSFGNNCADICPYTCLNPACCIFKQTKKELRPKSITFLSSYNGNYLTIYLNNEPLLLEIDYTNGYPITLFTQNTTIIDCENINKSLSLELKELINNNVNETFKNYLTYGNISEFDYMMKITNETLLPIHKGQIYVAKEVRCLKKNNNDNDNLKINGIIGLGYFNQLSADLIKEKYAERSLTAYKLNQNGTVTITIGNFPDEALTDFNKFAICEILKPKNNDFFQKDMSCSTKGIKLSNDNKCYNLNNTNVTFSLHQNSSIILSEFPYFNFIMKHYFNHYQDKCTNNTENGLIEIACSDDINKNRLPNFGFVMSKHVFSYKPKELFSNNTFLIKFKKGEYSRNFENQIIIGKEYLENSDFAINNEEGNLFLYSNPIIYTKIETECIDPPDNPTGLLIEAWQIAIIVVLSVLGLNIIFFILYYLLKRRRMKSKNYIPIN